MILQLFADLLLQCNARVKHHPQQANHLKLRIEVGVHLADGVDQVGQSFQGKVFALHRNDHAVCGAQTIECEQAQSRRAINQNEVVIGIHRGEGRFQTDFAPFLVDQLHLCTGQFAVGSQHVVSACITRNACLGHTGFLQQHVVHTVGELALVHVRAHRCVALRIHIHQQHALPQGRQSGCQVHAGGGFANAAFLVGNAENFGHGVAPSTQER